MPREDNEKKNTTKSGRKRESRKKKEDLFSLSPLFYAASDENE
jgi:hypothetical protein